MTQAEELSIKTGPDSTSPQQTRHQPPHCQHKSFHNENIPGKPYKTFTVNSINWVSIMVAGLGSLELQPHTPPLSAISAHTEQAVPAQTETQSHPSPHGSPPIPGSAPRALPTPPAPPDQLQPGMEELCRQSLQGRLCHSQAVKSKPPTPSSPAAAEGTQLLDICQSPLPASSLSHTFVPRS